MIGGKVEGLDGLLKKVGDLEKKAAKSLVRKAVTDGSGVVLKAVKPKIPQDTGSLKKAFGRKTAVSRKSGIAVGIVGPRRKFKKDKKTGKRVLTKAGERYDSRRWPTKYFHLVEFGTKNRVQKKTGRNTGMVKAKRPLTTATSGSATTVQATMADVFKTGLGL